jgi:hypothetical protein
LGHIDGRLVKGKKYGTLAVNRKQQAAIFQRTDDGSPQPSQGTGVYEGFSPNKRVCLVTGTPGI